MDAAIAVRPGEHACCRFPAADDRARCAAAYVRQALSRGHKVLYLSDHDDIEAFTGGLRTDARIAAGLDDGHLDVVSAIESYMPDGWFDVERMLAYAREQHAAAIAAGYPGLALTGEMSWALCEPPGCDQLPDYEQRLAELLVDGTLVFLCQYDHARFGLSSLEIAERHEVDLSPELARLTRDGYLSAARIDNRSKLRLAGQLDFASAAALDEVLSGHFPGPLRVDVADLEFADVAGLRALRGRTGRKLTIDGASQTVQRLVALLGWDTDPDIELEAA